MYKPIAQRCVNTFLTRPAPCYAEQDIQNILISVLCFNTGDCVNGDIRLAKGETEAYNEGRVETCSKGQWLTVCGDSWTARNSMVACRNLGFSDAPGCTLSK